ncbi:glucans biosynthesis glucosyltransferase MdoH [Tranquillimonas rosea]|uniref:glucans biosynthesis glucosyltransferase MdoH n=1 Tax=Tranquillimonas rosea TaxID=641238 RepID=UPI003BAC96BC
MSTPRPSNAAAMRLAAVLGSLACAAAAVILYNVNSGSRAGIIGALADLALFGATFWLAWGAAQALLGLPPRRSGHAVPTLAPDTTPTETCVVAIPIYNEDPADTFSRIAAMDSALSAYPEGKLFQFAILSDTTDPEIAEAEAEWFLRLLSDRNAEGRIFYRRRESNVGRKAGNLRDFVESSGGAWDHVLVLDADSLMAPETMIEMLRRMEAEPRLSLLQTVPLVINSQSLFARATQFSGALFSPVFSRGVARMQGETGPFWGHNAMIRMRAFAECCGLPDLPGSPPFGGPILSHDYVEAALLARGGWIVRLDDDLGGSFEEGPANLIAHAKRDRRWCQGNLQHARLIGAPRLRLWSRFVFVQGILAYVASLFWLCFLVATIAAAALPAATNYFPHQGWSFPVFPGLETTRALELAIGVAGLLLLPKALIVVDAALRGRARGFGGAGRATLSALAEVALASLVAPILLVFTVRAIGQILAGRDGGWPAAGRDDGSVPLGAAARGCWWMVVIGAALLTFAALAAPGLVLWLLPVALPLILSPVIIWWTSQPSAALGLFRVPQEVAPAPVTVLQSQILARWQDRDAPPNDAAPPSEPLVPAGGWSASSG